jgi:hypothetical protein
MANEEEGFESELEGEEDDEEVSLIDRLAEFETEDIPNDAERIKELVSSTPTDKLALSEIAETVLPLLAELTVMVRELAEDHDETAGAVFDNPTRSALLPADGRLIVSALHHAYEWALVVKAERLERQDRVSEAVEVVTELRVAYERALELLIDSEEPAPAADPLKVVRSIAGAKVTKPAEPPTE